MKLSAEILAFLGAIWLATGSALGDVRPPPIDPGTPIEISSVVVAIFLTILCILGGIWCVKKFGKTN